MHPVRNIQVVTGEALKCVRKMFFFLLQKIGVLMPQSGIGSCHFTRIITVN